MTTSTIPPKRVRHPVTSLDPSVPVDAMMTPSPAIPSGVGVMTARLELAESEGDEIIVVDTSHRPLGVLARDPVAMEWCRDATPRRPVRLVGEECDPEGWPLPTPAPVRVDEVMLPIHVCLAAGSTVEEACRLMSKARCMRAVVVNPGGRLLGVVTARAVLDWVAAVPRRTRPAAAATFPHPMGA